METAARAPHTMRQLPLAIGLEPQMSFDSFVVGANQEAVAQMRRLAAAVQMPAAGGGGPAGAPLAPIYLWGEPGCGKTHLLTALADAAQRGGRKLAAFRAGQALPWEFRPDWAALVFDGVDRFSPDEQALAFALFIEATGAGMSVLAAGRVPPVDLALRDDLRTRLAWGLVYELRPPGDADTRAALRRQADERGLILKDEMFEHLLTHFPRDLGALSHLLARLDHYSLATTRRITLPMLRAMLDDEARDAATPAGELAEAR
jgi:DnaA family protein